MAQDKPQLEFFFPFSKFGHPVVYRGPVKPRHQAELAAPVVLFTVFIAWQRGAAPGASVTEVLAFILKVEVVYFAPL